MEFFILTFSLDEKVSKKSRRFANLNFSYLTARPARRRKIRVHTKSPLATTPAKT
jgi:hypothetical protein